ncbi:MAG: GLPGLI family protein [Gelidibacter sp.]|nr:GLPGLI family protein [Gelidibacter sp.]
MKKTLIFIFLLFSILIYSQQKITGKVVYNISLIPLDKSKKSESNQIPKEDKQKAMSIIKNIKDVQFALIFNNNESLYKVIDKMESDANQSLNLAKVVAGGDDLYYNNIELNYSVYQRDDGGEMLLVSYLGKKWNLTQEKIYIGSYLCYKATLNKENNFAWYTPEIPVNFGPNKYHGLPGLVLEVQIGGLTFKASEIILNPKESILMKKPKGKKIKEDEYHKRYKDFLKEF